MGEVGVIYFIFYFFRVEGSLGTGVEFWMGGRGRRKEVRIVWCNEWEDEYIPMVDIEENTYNERVES